MYEFANDIVLDKYIVRLAESSLMGPIISVNENFETMLLNKKYTADLHLTKPVGDSSI